MMKRVLLGSSALVVAVLVGGGSVVAQDGGGGGDAVEVVPGGALDVTIGGFIRGLAIGGARDNLLLDESVSTGLDFFNDTEVHVEVEGESEATGLTYGGTVEFEADTNRTDNTDESFVFLEGGFGDFRFGDEDGVTDSDGLNVSAASLAAGTDGLESDQFEDLFGGFPAHEPIGTSDSTKIRYYTPSFGGLQLGVSYTPNQDGVDGGDTNGDTIASRDVEAGDIFEGGLKVEREVGDIGLEAALIGLYGDIKDEDEVGGDDYWAAQLGALINVIGIDIAGSYLRQQVGAAEVDAITAGVSVGFGPPGGDDQDDLLQVSLNYGQIINSDDLTVTTTSGEDLDGDGENDEGEAELDKPWTLILSATLAVMPGLTLDGDVGYFDNDASGDVFSGGDDGYQALGRLGLAF